MPSPSRDYFNCVNSTVDDFVLRKLATSTNRNSFQRAARNGVNINQLRTTNFNRFQYALESGSGPGGRRFKSSLPAQFFSIACVRHDSTTWFWLWYSSFNPLRGFYCWATACVRTERSEEHTSEL